MRFFLGLVAWLLVPLFFMVTMLVGIPTMVPYIFFFYLPASVCLIVYLVICRKNRSRAEVRTPIGLTWIITSALMATLSFMLLTIASPGGIAYDSDLESYGLRYAQEGLERAKAQHQMALSTIALMAAIGYYRFLRQEDTQKEGDTL